MATLTRNEEKLANIAIPNFQHTEKFTDLSSRKLKNLDMTLVLTAYGSLTTVNLSNNLLTTLPYSFSQCLSHVQVLDLSRNRLQKLPDNFDLMQNLHTLIIYQNKLRTLPVCFGKLNNLRWLDLAANPLDPLLRQVCGDHLAQGSVVAKNVREFFYLLLKASELYEESETDVCEDSTNATENQISTPEEERTQLEHDLKTKAQDEFDDVYRAASVLYSKKLNKLNNASRQNQVKETDHWRFILHFLRFFLIYITVVFLLLAICMGPPSSLVQGGSMKQYPFVPSILINAISWFLFCTVYQLRTLFPSMEDAARVFVLSDSSWFGWGF